MDNIDFVTPFYNKRYNTSSLLEALSRLTSTEDIALNTIPFGTEDSPLSLFLGIHSKRRKVTLIYQNEDVFLFKLNYKYSEEGEEKSESGKFFVCNYAPFKNVNLAITFEKNTFFRRGLLPIIKSLYPKMRLTFIKHEKLMKLLQAFQERYDTLNLIISRASLKNRFIEKESGSKLVPMVGWPNMELDEALKWADQNDSWFQSIQFRLTEKKTNIAEISFTRQGIVKTNHLYDEVQEFFIKPVCKTLFENMEMFRNRSRRDTDSFSVRPLAISFSYDHFADPQDNTRFIRVMRRYNKAAISVLHGNPYIHITISDYFDGSNFDLWMVSPKMITIVPQMKGSVAAIERLVNHIFDSYAEGKIVDYSEVAC